MLEIDAQAIADRVSHLTKCLVSARKNHNKTTEYEILDELDFLLELLQINNESVRVF